MPAQSSRAALLDRRHDLELTQAHMSGIGPAPVGTMAMKDVCDLQLRAAHGRRARPRVAACPGSIVLAGRVGWLRSGSSYGDAGVKRRGVERGVPQKCLNHTNIDILFEQMRGEAVPQRMWRDALLDPRGLGGGVDGTTELASRQRFDRVCGRGTASPLAAAGCAAAPPAT